MPAANSSTRCQEIEQIGVWAAQNNLKLNSGNTKEMVIRVRGKCGKLVNQPAPCPDIERVSSICILGVTVNDQLSAADHVVNLLASSKSLLYALRALRVHGIPDVSLQEVFRATLLAKMTYAGPAWHGMACAQQAITQNWSRSLIDVGDLDTAAAMNRLYLNCTVKLTIVCSMGS